MTAWQLTRRSAAATSPPMESAGQGVGAGRYTGWWKLPLVAGLMPLGGCISVNAPDGPIVIELNINIRSEVVYRLADDATDTIEDNADIF